MIVFSSVERKITMHMQTSGKKGDGASLTSPDGDGNSDSSGGFVRRETCWCDPANPIKKCSLLLGAGTGSRGRGENTTWVTVRMVARHQRGGWHVPGLVLHLSWAPQCQGCPRPSPPGWGSLLPGRWCSLGMRRRGSEQSCSKFCHPPHRSLYCHCPFLAPAKSWVLRNPGGKGSVRARGWVLKATEKKKINHLHFKHWQIQPRVPRSSPELEVKKLPRTKAGLISAAQAPLKPHAVTNTNQCSNNLSIRTIPGSGPRLTLPSQLPSPRSRAAISQSSGRDLIISAEVKQSMQNMGVEERGSVAQGKDSACSTTPARAIFQGRNSIRQNKTSRGKQ